MRFLACPLLSLIVRLLKVLLTYEHGMLDMSRKGMLGCVREAARDIHIATRQRDKAW